MGPACVNSQKDTSAVGAILGGSVNSRMFCISALVAVSELFINFPPLRAFFSLTSRNFFPPLPFPCLSLPVITRRNRRKWLCQMNFPDALPVNYMWAFLFLFWNMPLFLWLGTSVQHTVKVGHQADLDYQLFHECNKIPSVGVPARKNGHSLE